MSFKHQTTGKFLTLSLQLYCQFNNKSISLYEYKFFKTEMFNLRQFYDHVFINRPVKDYKIQIRLD